MDSQPTMFFVAVNSSPVNQMHFLLIFSGSPNKVPSTFVYGLGYISKKLDVVHDMEYGKSQVFAK